MTFTDPPASRNPPRTMLFQIHDGKIYRWNYHRLSQFDLTESGY